MPHIKLSSSVSLLHLVTWMPAKATNYKQDILKLSSNWQERTWQISITTCFANISVDYTEFRIVLLQKPLEDPQFFMTLPKLLKCGSCRGGALLFFSQTPPCCKYWSIKQTYEVNIQCLTGWSQNWIRIKSINKNMT